jgi:hypothetical protein
MQVSDIDMHVVQEIERELAVVQAQKAYVESLLGNDSEAEELYRQVVSLDLQGDVATQITCTNNLLQLLAASNRPLPTVCSILKLLHCHPLWHRLHRLPCILCLCGP